MVYDVQTTIDPEVLQETLPPRWRLPCPSGDRTANGGISQASIDESCTQFTFVAENPNSVYRLSIPHDNSESPTVSKITNFPGDHYPAIAVGFEKMFIAFERNWKTDRDNLSGSVIRLGIASTGAERSCSELDAAPGVHSYEYPTEWYVGWPPLLDEGSGRIVQPFGKKGLLVLDTALCFTMVHNQTLNLRL
ncbi:hypothetical protein DXG01_013392 [Tephrocybe rancida]|nr:hypothetical protein DXG01_013392 [Tephrocybe rancida]